MRNAGVFPHEMHLWIAFWGYAHFRSLHKTGIPVNLLEVNPKDAVDQRELGRRIKANRLRVKLTQKTLAELLDVSYQMIQRYERGAARVSNIRLNALAKALGVSFDELLGERPDQGMLMAQESFGSRTLSEQERQLLGAFNQMTNKAQKRLVVELVRSMAASG